VIDRRAAAARFVAHYFPSDCGDPLFAEIINGRWSPGAGTTCTYPCALLLFLLGCFAPELVNYDAPNGATRFDIGAGVSKIVQGARALGCWVDDGPGREPGFGDIGFLSQGPPLTEHVLIVMDPSVWRDASGGQTNAQGNQAARIVDRQIDDQRAAGGVRRLSNPLPIGGGFRQLQGWVSLDLVPWSVAPIGVAADNSITSQIGGAVPAWGWLAAGAVLLGAFGAAAIVATRPDHPLSPDAKARRKLLGPVDCLPIDGTKGVACLPGAPLPMLAAYRDATREAIRTDNTPPVAAWEESLGTEERAAVVEMREQLAREAALLRAAGPMREHLAAIQAGPWGHTIPRSHVPGFLPE
jgi:hypothetical protein